MVENSFSLLAEAFFLAAHVGWEDDLAAGPYSGIKRMGGRNKEIGGLHS